jgi:DNA-binding transcriptional ArsR family regulator
VRVAESKRAQRAARRIERIKKLSFEQRLLKALSHPLRVELLDRMNESEWSPRALSDELNEGLSQVSYHVKVLKDFKLIELTRTEPRRGAIEHFYRAVERAFVPSGMAQHIPKSAQQIIGSAIIEKIDRDVAASLKSGKFYAREDWHASWTPLPLDDLGRAKAERLADEFVERFIELGAEAANRAAESGDDSGLIWTSAAVLVYGSEEGHKGQAPGRRSSPENATN